MSYIYSGINKLQINAHAIELCITCNIRKQQSTVIAIKKLHFFYSYILNGHTDS